MAIKRDYCVNHPDRLAMGRCVITHRPICSECSTQYEGVNYSLEGLKKLHGGDAAGKAPGWLRRNRWLAIASIAAPLMLLQIIIFLYQLFRSLMAHR